MVHTSKATSLTQIRPNCNSAYRTKKKCCHLYMRNTVNRKQRLHSTCHSLLDKIISQCDPLVCDELVCEQLYYRHSSVTLQQ